MLTRGARSALLAVSLFVGLGAATSASAHAPSPAPAMRLTAADVAASNAKVGAAYAALVQMWGTRFQALGVRFQTPEILRYRGAARTACGIVGANNASYCPNDNSIYYDEIFVAAQAKRAASELGTDGDMAAVGVIAHEMGHAVAIQLGHESRIPYENESVADCLAGAFARQANADGQIEPGDMDEAFYGMASAGDPTPELTGNSRIDRRIVLRASMLGHGTREQRQQNFRAGLDGGAGACIAELR
jgi:predicted metalloprotease